MGSKRLGLARTQALLENLKRSLALGATEVTCKKVTCSNGVVVDADGVNIGAGGLQVDAGGIIDKNVTKQSGTGAEDLTSTAANLIWWSSAAQAGDITLPQATASNVGMIIRVFACADWSGTEFKLGFANGGSTVMTGNLQLGAIDAAAGDENISFKVTTNTKSIRIDSDAVDRAGGAIGSMYTFYYLEANLVFVEAKGLITTGTPAPSANASTTGGV